MCKCPESTPFIIEAGVMYWCPNCKERFLIEEMPGYGKPKAPKSKAKKKQRPTTPPSTPVSGTAAVKAKGAKSRPVTFAITGVLPSGKSKAKFAQEMEGHGHSFSKSFAGGTQVLICEKNRVNDRSAKKRRAEGMGIPIVSEKEFVEEYCPE